MFFIKLINTLSGEAYSIASSTVSMPKSATKAISCSERLASSNLLHSERTKTTFSTEAFLKAGTMCFHHDVVRGGGT